MVLVWVCFNTLILTFGYIESKTMATLALGSRPRQGVVSLQAKWETRESHHMLPGMQRVWGNRPSHSQVNSHGESWSPKLTPETSESDLRGQNSMNCGIVYIIGKLLERRCLKWAHIAHLDIWNISYGQKKGWESNWQFDSPPQKIGNRPDLLIYRRRATYYWKALDESYNFALDCILIGGLLAKLWGSKVAGVPTWAIWMWAPWPATEYTIMGEGGGFPQVQAVVSLVCPCCPWLILAPKVLQLCTNHLVWVLCKPVWVSEVCQLFLVPSRNSSTPFYSSKCCESGSVPRLLLLPQFSTWTHIWVPQGVGSASNTIFLIGVEQIYTKNWVWLKMV
jgi:hypothetical protein